MTMAMAMAVAIAMAMNTTTTTLTASATMMATTSNLYLRACAVRFNSYDRLCRVPLTLIIMTVLFARS